MAALLKGRAAFGVSAAIKVGLGRENVVLHCGSDG
jgi:hypothetical protein